MAAIAVARAYQHSFDTRPNATLAVAGGALTALGDVVAQVTQNIVRFLPLSTDFFANLEMSLPGCPRAACEAGVTPHKTTVRRKTDVTLLYLWGCDECATLPVLCLLFTVWIVQY